MLNEECKRKGNQAAPFSVVLIVDYFNKLLILSIKSS